MDLTTIRERLSGARGQDYWRSLEELAGTPEFQDFLENEFPQQAASDWRSPLDRRSWLKFLGASLAFGGLAGCTKQPPEKIVPYVRAPEEFASNKPLHYATASLMGGYATGTLVESHHGRPTKVEGNPQHPGSLGATDLFAQADILTLYDPDRTQAAIKEGRTSSALAFLGEVSLIRERKLLVKGAGLRILTGTVTSPTLAAQLRKVLADFPEAKWHQWEPATTDGARLGAVMAFGDPVHTYYKVEPADVILSLDSDFLYAGPGAVRYAREFAARRRAAKGARPMNRLYAAEVTPTVTGSMADHRLPVRHAEVLAYAMAVAAKLGVAGVAAPVGVDAKWVDAVVQDLEAHKGASLVVAGDQQPPEVHALVHAINDKLGNAGKTVVYTSPVEASPAGQLASLQELAEDINSGKVDTLLVLSANPVYTAPADLQFREAFLKVKTRLHLGLYRDETAVLANWHVPETHSLETWSDACGYDGTVTILQPLIDPLYGGKSAHEVLAALLGQQEKPYDIVKRFWREKMGKPANFETWWQTAVHDGVVPASAPAPRTPALKADFSKISAPAAQGLEITFRPDPCVWDGRFANNGWLQELPKPATKLTWDNVAHVSPSLAEKLGVASEDLIELKLDGRTVEAPVWVTPGQARESITVHLGYGRTHGGKVAAGMGFDACKLRTTGAFWHGAGVQARKLGRKYKLACTQTHHGMEGRALVRVGTQSEYLEHPEFAQHMEHVPPKGLTLYPEHKYEGYSWGMAVDLNSCTGCNACVVACQSENNIAVVGKEEVARGREMHWIRIDRYHKGDLDNPAAYAQPVMCQHCENAPCEPVCPVAATVHSNEGLNQMVYNRCIGTRYCSNNCPYKVRRFNFFLYSDWETPSLEPMRNPNVTVRSRGVMEKCSYCVQRINASRITAEKENRQIRDGEVVTACQQVCPTEAITFGDINDKSSKVSGLRGDPRNYSLLADLNTRPRTTYLARLTNPNPALEPAKPASAGHGEHKG